MFYDSIINTFQLKCLTIQFDSIKMFFYAELSLCTHTYMVGRIVMRICDPKPYLIRLIRCDARVICYALRQRTHIIVDETMIPLIRATHTHDDTIHGACVAEI